MFYVSLFVFFKIIFEHIIWSFKKFDESKLPGETLKKK